MTPKSLAVANALPYGSAAYVYSSDLDRAWSFAEHLEVGGVGVNVNDTTESPSPFRRNMVWGIDANNTPTVVSLSARLRFAPATPAAEFEGQGRRRLLQILATLKAGAGAMVVTVATGWRP